MSIFINVIPVLCLESIYSYKILHLDSKAFVKYRDFNQMFTISLQLTITGIDWTSNYYLNTRDMHKKKKNSCKQMYMINFRCSSSKILDCQNLSYYLCLTQSPQKKYAKGRKMAIQII